MLKWRLTDKPWFSDNNECVAGYVELYLPDKQKWSGEWGSFLVYAYADRWVLSFDGRDVNKITSIEFKTFEAVAKHLREPATKILYKKCTKSKS